MAIYSISFFIARVAQHCPASWVVPDFPPIILKSSWEKLPSLESTVDFRRIPLG